MRFIPLILIAAFLPACFEADQTSFSSQPTIQAVEHDDLPHDEYESLGGPIPGLSQSELAAFFRGKKVFERRFTPSGGLGPLYNATSCASCHSHPVSGGSAPLYRNFYIAARDFGSFQSPLLNLPSVVVPAFGEGPHASAVFTTEGQRREIPATESGVPVIVTQRNSIPIFGTGLFEFISNATIMSNADPDDLDLDGISGRFNVDLGVSGAIGRFGVKLQSNAVEFFTRGPLQNQMGITSAPHQGSGAIVSLCSALRPQAGSGADDPTTDNDGVPDPEITHNDLGDLIAFTRFLAPPRPKPPTIEAAAGESLFQTLNCAACHISELPSSRGPVRAYTDLLLHDMGSLADGIHMGAPQSSTVPEPLTSNEFRTQPLWGVSLHGPWLHDGRAETLRESVELHDGEALASRNAFLALSPADQALVLTFLESL